MDDVVASTASLGSTGRQPKRGAAETTNDRGRFDDESRCYSVIITVARDSAPMTVLRRERGRLTSTHALHRDAALPDGPPPARRLPTRRAGPTARRTNLRPSLR